MKQTTTPSCLIVDDNKVAIAALRQLLKQINDVNIVSECTDALEAKKILESENIDILFLDIEMPGMSGIDLLRVIPEQKRPLTIFTTAKQGYALEAFELNVVDYLVKPIGLSRLLLSVDRARELLAGKEARISGTPSTSNFFIKDQKTIRKINLDEVLWFESKGDYIRIITDEKTYVIHSSLKIVDNFLSTSDFFRIHRGYIINLHKIDYIEDRIVHIHGQPLPISDGYKEALLKNLNLLQ